jgi:hypothetical protein
MTWHEQVEKALMFSAPSVMKTFRAQKCLSQAIEIKRFFRRAEEASGALKEIEAALMTFRSQIKTEGKTSIFMAPKQK